MNEKQISERWDRSAPFYDGAYGKMEFYPKMIERIAALADPSQDDVVLDIGTGTGELALKIAPKVKKVIGIDISGEMLNLAREKARQENIKNVEFRLGSFTAPNVAEKFVIIVSNLAFEWVSDQDKRPAIKMMSSLLIESGKIVLGERMLFFDPKNAPEEVKNALREQMAKLTGKSVEQLEKEGLELAKKYQAEINEVVKSHQEIQFRAENLKKLLEENGFAVEKAEEFTPMFGIICARKN